MLHRCNQNSLSLMQSIDIQEHFLCAVMSESEQALIFREFCSAHFPPQDLITFYTNPYGCVVNAKLIT